VKVTIDEGWGEGTGYFDVYYIIALNTQEILSRIDTEDIKEVEKEAEFYGKEHPEIEIVRALRWREA